MGLITFPFKVLKFFLLFPINHTKLFLVYLLIHFIIALYIYIKMKPFYDSSKAEIHNKHPEFKRFDQVSLLRLFIGLSFLVWPRAILMVLSMTIM